MSLSPEIEARFRLAAKRQETYEANPATREYAQRVLFRPLVAISAAGKSTIIRILTDEYPDKFHFVKSYTTREQRDNETADDMHFIPHTLEAHNALMDGVEAGEFVQYAMHPTKLDFYGTKPDDYDPDKVNLMPTLATAIPKLAQSGYGGFEPVVIVPDIAAWSRVFKQQPFSREERIKRLEEAELSLKLCLARSAQYLWLRNPDGAVRQTAENLLTLSDDDDFSEPIAIAHRLLDAGVRPLLERIKESPAIN